MIAIARLSIRENHFRAEYFIGAIKLITERRVVETINRMGADAAPREAAPPQNASNIEGSRDETFYSCEYGCFVDAIRHFGPRHHNRKLETMCDRVSTRRRRN
jgi:hypothetical protein